MPAPVNLRGQRFGMLTAIEPAGSSAHGKRLWRCRCECGRECVVVAGQLRSGKTRSCGCIVMRLVVALRERHGDARPGHRAPEYGVWCMMKRRCSNAGLPEFENYGARGVTVCARWRESYEAFREDMGPRPRGTSIDRIDNDGHYSCGHCAECAANGWPANCRWATRLEQNRNTRVNVRVTFQGETLCIGEWADRTGLRASTIARRLREGWRVDAALTLPPQPPYRSPPRAR